MMKRHLGLGLLALVLAAGCGGGGSSGAGGSGSSSSGAGGAEPSGSSSGSSGSAGGSSSASGGGGAGGSSSGSGGSGGSASGSGGGSSAVTAQDLLARVANCAQLPGTTKFATDDGEPNTIPVCGLKNAVWWRADMDIDCDGKQSAQCNINTDPAYQNQTSATDSNGNPLDAAKLPYVVVPLPGNGFNYTKAGLQLGSVIAVIYKDKVEYGIFGDEGPNNIIGESSYAMATLLGIPNDPSNGGVDCTNNGCPVTYIAFTGGNAVVTTNEDHAEAQMVGESRAKQFLIDNP
jgi:hypothetical protein